VQHKSDKAHAFKGKQGTTSGIDLMIVALVECGSHNASGERTYGPRVYKNMHKCVYSLYF
jgi:hypothetical protein